MGREKTGFIDSFMEKFAAQWYQRLVRPDRTLGAANRLYQQKAHAPVQKLRKAVGYGIAGAVGTGMAAHYLLKAPQQQMSAEYGNNWYGGE